MTISNLTKILNKVKRKHGNLDVVFDALTVSDDASTILDEFYSAVDADVLGVFKLRSYDDNKLHKALVLGNPNYDSAFAGQKDLI